MHEKTDTTTPSNAFMKVLQAHGNGEAIQNLSEAMRKCIEATMETGKPSGMQLKVKFKPAAKGSAIVVDIEPVTVKVPLESKQSLWFADDGFNLHREDTKQEKFKFQPVKLEDQPAEVQRVAEPEPLPAQKIQ